METIKNIIERRSIRKYTNKNISDEDLNQILKAAMYAPSGVNAQPWEFVVVRDKKLLSSITEIQPYSQPLNQADAAIIVCGDLNKQVFKDLWIQDCSAATQNILLAANDLGIGSVWLGIYPNEEIVSGLKNLINAPENIVPFSVVSLGYPDEERQTSERFDEAKIHFEKF